MLWVKAFHIIFMVTWFAALFYLPRLFVYHADSSDETSNARFKIMERKLFYGITTPSAIVAIILGSWLLIANSSHFMAWWWMHVKLAMVALVIVYHFVCWRFMISLREQRSQRSHRYFRVFNELPVFLLVGIVILIVVKPTL